MKRRSFLLIPALASLLAGCAVNLNFDAGKDLTKEVTKGTLGDFTLLAPAENAIVHDLPTFSWTESANALNYTLEVCSSDTFDPTARSVVYAKETNIGGTSFKLSSNLNKKNTTYYWRVTAVNEYNTKSVGKEKKSAVSTFVYNIDTVGEIEIGVGEKSDWALHEVGSYAEISIDETDFFGTGDKDSLKITFEKENTSQGPGHEKSDGWLSVQKATELDLFDCDAFICNFYFSGHDSTILIRIIDQDGELWYKYVKFTMDSRQLILLRFDEFVLRTVDTVVQNQVFDHEHIQAIEVCFEQTFGDGCCIVGGLKAVNYDDYGSLFISKLNFNSDPSKWGDENYEFAKTIDDEGYSMKLEYSPSTGLNGWGFAKVYLDKYFGEGNAIRVKIRYTGVSSGVSSVIRIVEPDKDRWSYTYPYSELEEGVFQEITIPFMAFEQSDISEGKRQFYYISQIQFGLKDCYGAGSITYKDFEVITVASVDKNPRIVGADGIIDNFDTYKYRGEMYSQWETSINNKDEGMFIEQKQKIKSSGNVYSGKFTYKSDMSMATYDIYTQVEAENLNALKFWIKDASTLSTDERFKEKDPSFCSPTVVLQLAFKDGRWYRYTIDQAPRYWTEYIVPFDAFTLNQGPSLPDKPLLSQNVINFAFGMQYFYMYNGASFPVYMQNNPVYFDNIMFVEASSELITSLETPLTPDANGVTLIDNFEYASNEALNEKWIGQNGYNYETITLSDDVSKVGGDHSMKLDYKGATSPKYVHYPLIGNTVNARALVLDIKGDDKCELFINLYIPKGNNAYLQYRCTISKPEGSWNNYIIGLDKANWKGVTGTPDPSFKKDSMRKVSMITFGAVNNNDSTTVSSFYIDNLRFEYNDVDYLDYIITPLAVE